MKLACHGMGGSVSRAGFTTRKVDITGRGEERGGVEGGEAKLWNFGAHIEVHTERGGGVKQGVWRGGSLGGD